MRNTKTLLMLLSLLLGFGFPSQAGVQQTKGKNHQPRAAPMAGEPLMKSSVL